MTGGRAAGGPVWTRHFSLLLAGTFLQGSAIHCLLPALPLFVTEGLDAGPAAIGPAVGIFSLTAVLIRPLGGYLLDRFGRRGWMLGASGLFCACLFAYLWVDSYAGLIAVRLVHGLGWGLVGVAGLTAAADLVPNRRRGEGLGAFGLAMPLALAIGPMLGDWLVADGRFARLFAGAGLLGVVAWICFVSVRFVKVADSRARFELSRVFERRVGRLFFLWLLPCMGFGGLVSYAPLYVRQLGFDGVGPLYSLYAMGALSVRWFAGRWYDRAGPAPVMLIGLGASVAGWVLIGATTWKACLLAGALVMGMGFGVAVPAFQTMAADLVPAVRRGAANALVFSAYDIGIALGAVGAGLVAERIGLRAVYLSAAGLNLLAMGLFAAWVYPYFQRRRLRRDQART